MTTTAMVKLTVDNTTANLESEIGGKAKTIASEPTQGPNPGTVTADDTAAGVAIDFGSLSSLGLVVISNLHASNHAEIGLQVGGVFYPFMVCRAGGEEYLLRLKTGVTYYIRAVTATSTPDVSIRGFNDGV